MEQHELRPPRGAKKPRKRVGRGNASGKGTYSGRGLKGQQARAGSGPGAGFEGGQTPLIRRLPTRRGFHNLFRVEYTPVNLRDLSRVPAGNDVTPESLRDAGIVRSLRRPIKLLADGDVTTALTVRTHRVSAAARAKIEAAGGTVEELTPYVKKERKRKAAIKAAEKAAASANAREEKPKGGTDEPADDEESDDSGSESPTAD